MRIDQTRFDAFWRNPEAYRIRYECNLVPVALSYGLARGSALHLIAEHASKGLSRPDIQAILVAENLSDRAIAMAWVLWDEFQRQYGNDPRIRKIDAEMEFDYRIPGSPHSLVGRIDELLEWNGALWCGELKTASAKAYYDRTRNDWETKKQADFEIIGARSLGYDVRGVLVRTIVESTPIKIWPFEVTRTEHQLEATKLQVHETCELIEFMRRTFGSDMPWPHVCFSYPCSKPDACEYASLCCQNRLAWTESDLEQFKPREEHLELMKK